MVEQPGDSATSSRLGHWFHQPLSSYWQQIILSYALLASVGTVGTPMHSLPLHLLCSPPLATFPTTAMLHTLPYSYSTDTAPQLVLPHRCCTHSKHIGPPVTTTHLSVTQTLTLANPHHHSLMPTLLKLTTLEQSSIRCFT